MTETKRLSLAGRLRMASVVRGPDTDLMIEAADAIEQHEAFAQEVSDEAMDYKHNGKPDMWFGFDRFIIPAPKPDPLVEAMKEVGLIPVADNLRAALEARGLEIRSKNDD